MSDVVPCNMLCASDGLSPAECGCSLEVKGVYWLQEACRALCAASEAFDEAGRQVWASDVHQAFQRANAVRLDASAFTKAERQPAFAPDTAKNQTPCPEEDHA